MFAMISVNNNAAVVKHPDRLKLCVLRRKQIIKGTGDTVMGEDFHTPHHRRQVTDIQIRRQYIPLRNDLTSLRKRYI